MRWNLFNIEERNSVLLVNYEMTYTGSPRALLNLARALRKLKYVVDVWTLNEGPFEKEFAENGFFVKRIDFPEQISQELEEKIKCYTYVIANTVFCATFASYAMQFTETILYIMEADNLPQLIRDCSLNINDIKNANHLLCVSKYAQQSIMNTFEVEEIGVLPNFVEQWRGKKKSKTVDGCVKFLVSGTIEFRKGQEIAEDAFLMLPHELQQKAELHFIGQMPVWSKEYQNLLYTRQNEEIIFHEEIHNKDRLFEFYNSMNVIIVASRDESCSLVALEAAMLSKALLVTENTGAKYVVADETCILPTGNAEKLMKKMQEYILNPDLCKKEGKKNHKKYLQYGTRKFFINELKKYMSLLKEEVEDMNKKISEEHLGENVTICSVIIPIEGQAERNIRETVSSLVEQVLNPNENLQIVVLGDGSKIGAHNKEELFEKENITITFAEDKKCNDEIIEGEWVCMGRVGDIYSPNYFSKIYNYITDKNMLYVSQYYKHSGAHFMQNIFYEKERIVSIDKNPEVMLDYFDTIWIPNKDFFLSLLAQENYNVASMRIALSIVFEKRRYQILGSSINEGVYGAEELRNGEIPSHEYLRDVYLRLINYGLTKKGKVEKYIQYCLLALFKNYIAHRYNIKNLLEDMEISLEDYKGVAIYCLSYINYDVLWKNTYLSLEQKLFILRKGEELCNKYLYENNSLYVTNGNKMKILYSPIVDYLFANISNDELRIEGDVFVPFLESGMVPRVFFKNGDDEYEATIKRNYQPETLFETEVITERIFFDVVIPLSSDGVLSCWIKLDGEHKIECNRYRYSQFFPVSVKYKNQYFADNGWIIHADSSKVVVEKDSNGKSCDCEKEFSAQLTNEQKVIRDYIFAHKKNEKVWLIWDRPNAAGDNGEALFKYLMENKVNNECYYFVLNRDCKDFDRLMKLYPLNILETGSLSHKKMFAIADVLVGSQTDSPMWPVDREVFRDIISQKPFAFLQHGITKNDMSQNYSKYYQNIRLFVTAGIPEYENTKKVANYGFEENMVQLLGFPRFDLLKNNSEKYIVVLPTWRKYCVEKNSDGENVLKHSFENTEYYKFYAALFSNRELLETCHLNGYKILFMQHNVLKSGNVYFRNFEDIEIADDSWTYNRVLSDAALLITDYSSVSFDFAYLEKPLIYCQFDKEKFYSTHTYQEGYFEYERDGFGPVVYDCESAVKEIIDAINEKCRMKQEYRNRVRDFFGYHDSNNCKRVANAIREVVERYE